MSNQPLVSIIIPTYQRPQLLLKTLKSLVNQTYKNIEILIINNYPKDNLNPIVNQLKDRRIKLYTEKKKNTAHARNLGLKKAKGKYICFCDDDDLYLADKIKLQLKFMQNNPPLGL